MNGGTPISGNLHIHIIYWTHNCHLYAYNRNQDRIGDFNGLFGEKYKKTSLKIELLMDPWKSAASPVLPLDISWLNPQQATFKGQMIHTVYYVLNRRKWFEVTAQGKADPTSFSIPWPFSMNDLVFKRCAEFLPFLHVNLIYFVFLCEPTSFCS